MTKTEKQEQLSTTDNKGMGIEDSITQETLEEIALLAAELMTHPDPRVRKVADSALSQKVEQPDDTPPSEIFPRKAEERFQGVIQDDEELDTIWHIEGYYTKNRALSKAKRDADQGRLYGYYELGADAPVWVGEKE